jgi:hypothetical protein
LVRYVQGWVSPPAADAAAWGALRALEEDLLGLLGAAAGEAGAGGDHKASSSGAGASGKSESASGGASGGRGKAGLGWRHELVATWALLHLQQPPLHPGPDPVRPEVWAWFQRCLGSGDGQPLQKVALGGLQRLLSLSLDAGCSGLPAALLADQAAAGRLLRALAFDRRGGGEEGQWSVGVVECVRDGARDGGAGRFPKTRLAHVSPLFKSKHARLAKHLTRAGGSAAARTLLRACERGGALLLVCLFVCLFFKLYSSCRI